MSLRGLTGGDDAITAMIHGAERVADDLAGPNPTSIERALCECAATPWLGWLVAEMAHHGADRPQESTALRLPVGSTRIPGRQPREGATS